MLSTSPTLINCLRGGEDPSAWDRFVNLYSAGIYSWTRAMGLQHADAADLVQDVFAVLINKIPDFEYNSGSNFRGWLWTITRNKFLERARRGRPECLPNAALDRMPEGEQEPFWEEEFRQHLIGRVIETVKSEFPTRVWQAFLAHVMDGKPASRVASELGMNIWAVYTAKARVLDLLVQEFPELVPGA